MSPPNKNQHYVPQSYLRGWATNEQTTIHLIKQQREIQKQSISNICSAAYFNSKEVILEKALAGLEKVQADAINHIRDGGSLRALSTGEQCMLMSFVTTQRQRSAVMRDEISDSAEEAFQEGLQNDLRNAGYDPNDYTEIRDQVFERTVQETHHFMIAHGVLSPFGMHDLEAAILENTTNLPFITSEAPIIFANPRFKRQYGLTYPGMGNRGIQIYCPLSPTQCLVFYDPEAYRVETDQDWNATVEDPNDVRELNMLQVFATDSFLIHAESNQTERMKSLVSDSSKYENWENIDQRLPSVTTEGGDQTYAYQPRHQLHNLTPTLGPIHILKNVSYGPRTSGTEVGRSIVHRIMNQSETTEKALMRSVMFMVRVTGLKSSAFPTVFD